MNAAHEYPFRNNTVWLYCTVLYCTVLYCTVLYCTVLYCTVLYCTVLYCTVLCWNTVSFIRICCNNEWCDSLINIVYYIPFVPYTSNSQNTKYILTSLFFFFIFSFVSLTNLPTVCGRQGILLTSPYSSRLVPMISHIETFPPFRTSMVAWWSQFPVNNTNIHYTSTW